MVEIRYGDFELCIAGVTPEDFVYFDPPYYKQGGFSDFDRYTKFKFRENDPHPGRPPWWASTAAFDAAVSNSYMAFVQGILRPHLARFPETLFARSSPT